MANAEHYTFFTAQKEAFLKQNFSKLEEIYSKVNEEIDYPFLAVNLSTIKQEFSDTYAIIKHHKKNRKIAGLQFYWCCLLLIKFHEAYPQDGQLEHYKALKTEYEIIAEASHQVVARRKKESFAEELMAELQAALQSLLEVPLHISRIRHGIGFANAIRLYWTFCRLTLTQLFLVMQELLILDKLAKWLRTSINLEAIIKIMEGPNPVLRILSVVFFAARFLINGGITLKHTFFPSTEEQKLSSGERFKMELYKRHVIFLNDFVWGTVNLLTNFAKLFNIPSPVANWLVAGFLIFDVLLLLWQRHLAEKEYVLKHDQYTQQLTLFEENDEGAVLLKAQRNELEINWQTKNATLLFNAAAASLLLIGFSASLLLSAPLLIAASYMVCTIAVAMYLTADSYGTYHQEKQRLVFASNRSNYDDELEQQREEQTQEEKYRLARNDFIATMARNALFPPIMITAVALYWPLAILLAAAYGGYKLILGYQSYKQSFFNKPPSETRSRDEALDVSSVGSSL